MTVLAVSEFLEAFFVVLIFLPLAMLWAAGVVDIIRRDYSGWATAGWLLLVIVLPIFGTLLYFILRKPTEEEIAYAQRAAQETERAAAADAVDRLTKLSELRDKGEITEEEYTRKREALIG